MPKIIKDNTEVIKYTPTGKYKTVFMFIDFMTGEEKFPICTYDELKSWYEDDNVIVMQLRLYNYLTPSGEFDYKLFFMCDGPYMHETFGEMMCFSCDMGGLSTYEEEISKYQRSIIALSHDGTWHTLNVFVSYDDSVDITDKSHDLDSHYLEEYKYPSVKGVIRHIDEHYYTECDDVTLLRNSEGKIETANKISSGWELPTPQKDGDLFFKLN